MQNTNQFWLYPIIIAAGLLQAWGPPMNGALQKSLSNPWLASVVSFLPVISVLGCVFLCMPRPMPTGAGLTSMPWWAPLGGLIGAVAVVVGLMFVNKVGAGTLAGLTISANLIMSLFIDKYGWFGVEVHALSWGRIGGCLLMITGVYLISKF
ncbi:DMT family transporter [Mucilaginibacter sp. 21P]|uniref:DMT family transporter n=1 Tax=Mucilaginibacter sp. 21P TaxID=2778902 RepID=UPI001C57B54D|nr:DMT family transporter [Mucilaginibacter sp. 21P]QXV63759.1 DMT family transporter [Mucilaginibacter sp. 21P]